ncbi:MAG: spore germination protein GerW family protein [Caldilineaceae bacterium]
MTENIDYTHVVAANWEKSMNVINRLFDAAKPSAVFGEPMQKGDYTVITASEVMVGMGLGTGAGSGSSQPDENDTVEDKENAAPEIGSGAGGGGGGGSWSRPVAVISVSPHGVEVEPVVDVTKWGLAFFTMLGSAAFMLRKMKEG